MPARERERSNLWSWLRGSVAQTDGRGEKRRRRLINHHVYVGTRKRRNLAASSVGCKFKLRFK